MVKVMIVEDEYIERKALAKMIMSMYEFRVKIIAELEDGKEAVEAMQTCNPDIIFMDIQMHKMDGLKASEIIKSIRPNVHIILVTAFSEFEYAKKAIQIGVEDYLVKPYSRKTLKELVDKQLLDVEENKVEIIHYSDNQIIESAIFFIAENYMKDIKLEDIAKVVGLSKYHFTRIFKQETNKTYIEYLTEFRIEKAKRLLDTTGKSVKEISYEVGYIEPNYFAKIFKKYTGISPSKYK